MEASRYAAHAALTYGRLWFRRLGCGRSGVRARPRDAAEKRAGVAVYVRRHSVSSLWCRARAQARRSQADAARLSARAHFRSGASQHGALARSKGRNASAADRRLAVRDGLARIRTLRGARSRPSRALFRGLFGPPALRSGLVAGRSQRAEGSGLRERLRRPSALPGAVARSDGRAFRRERIVPARNVLAATLQITRVRVTRMRRRRPA